MQRGGKAAAKPCVPWADVSCQYVVLHRLEQAGVFSTRVFFTDWNKQMCLCSPLGKRGDFLFNFGGTFWGGNLFLGEFSGYLPASTWFFTDWNKQVSFQHVTVRSNNIINNTSLKAITPRRNSTLNSRNISDNGYRMARGLEQTGVSCVPWPNVPRKHVVLHRLGQAGVFVFLPRKKCSICGGVFWGGICFWGNFLVTVPQARGSSQTGINRCVFNTCLSYRLGKTVVFVFPPLKKPPLPGGRDILFNLGGSFAGKNLFLGEFSSYRPASTWFFTDWKKQVCNFISKITSIIF